MSAANGCNVLRAFVGPGTELAAVLKLLEAFDPIGRGAVGMKAAEPFAVSRRV